MTAIFPIKGRELSEKEKQYVAYFDKVMDSRIKEAVQKQLISKINIYEKPLY
jgi:hypothetical protein